MNIIRLSVLVCSLLMTATAFSEEDEQKDVLFLSTPEQIATVNAESDHLIGGLISPLSGQPVLKQIDLIAKGAQNIILNRSYIAPHIPCSFPRYKHNQNGYDNKHLYYHLKGNYKGWQFYPHLKLILNAHSREVRFSDPNGSTLDFSITNPNMESRLVSSPCAMCNVAGDVPSGLYDLRNTRVFCEENGQRIIVHAPDGAIRYYASKAVVSNTSYLYLLQKEILPNGKILKYHYDNDQLAAIESKDPKEQVTYASVHLIGNPGNGSCHFTSSSGTTADYSYQRRPIHWKIKEKKKKNEV